MNTGHDVHRNRTIAEQKKLDLVVSKCVFGFKSLPSSRTISAVSQTQSDQPRAISTEGVQKEPQVKVLQLGNKNKMNIQDMVIFT